MLSRTADHLYWMARYVERAENTARLLESAYQMAMMPQDGESSSHAWDTVLDMTADRGGFASRYGDASLGPVVGYMALDAENPSSIRFCLRRARENARETRHLLSTDLWESLNQTWLELQDLSYPRLMERGFSEFFTWVKDRAHLFQGVAFGTMRRGDAFSFTRLGMFVERADVTARILEVKYRILGNDDGAESATAYYTWGALLRALSGFRAYREIYPQGINPRHIAELLILRDDMPRSLHACVDHVRDILERLSDGAECARLAGRIHGTLHYGLVDDLFAESLPRFLARFIAANNALGTQIQRDFMMIP